MSDNNKSVRQNPHPLYLQRVTDWELCRDSYDGETAIKDKNTTYLPATSGMRLDGYGKGTENEGQSAYNAYKCRAYYPDIFMEAVQSAIGVMHRKPAHIELPPALESLLLRATDTGEDLQVLLRHINAQQLMTGRVALLGDLRIRDSLPEPILVCYNEDRVFNWDDSNDANDSQNLRLVEIDESCNVLSDDFKWSWQNRVRVLALTDPEGKVVNFDSNGELDKGAIYRTALLKDEDTLAGATFEDVSAQGTVSPVIPFTFINAKDLSAKPDKPPLDGLARLCLAIYRGEADYRQNLFMQGQETLVRIGGNFGGETDDNGDPIAVRTGAGSRLDVPVGGDAKYIGVSGAGLAEQRQALAADYLRAETKTSKLMGAGSGAESGDALRIRVAAQTATLPQIAHAGAAGLTKVLRDLATWLGDNPDLVVVKPNLEFTDSTGDALTLQQLITSKIAGAPISDVSIHAWMVEEGFSKITFEEELAYLAGEGPKI